MAKPTPRRWPQLPQRARTAVIAANGLAVMSFVYLGAMLRDCQGQGCGDFGFVFIIRPDLLIALVFASVVPVFDGFLVYYLVGSRLGLGTKPARRVMILLVGGVILVWLAAKLLYISN